ncbi:hypothetical protein IGI04_003513 [Brassica rapa subsp. trilocularis]|uniref:Uncharacterized protein n=1 Tax=Brassica rapa subsp. trilocularis TaxID=1813537 RepID=A0ABQ7NZ79_BRACM|nr:hypothetical protein IGI04_003513 [Brassica rapa subsp. trilocularis]
MAASKHESKKALQNDFVSPCETRSKPWRFLISASDRLMILIEARYLQTERCWQGDEASRLNECIVKVSRFFSSSSYSEEVIFRRHHSFLATLLNHSENFKSFTWKNVLNSSKRLLSGSNVVDIEKALFLTLFTTKRKAYGYVLRSQTTYGSFRRLVSWMKLKLYTLLQVLTSDLEGQVAEEGMEEEEEENENEEN